MEFSEAILHHRKKYNGTLFFMDLLWLLLEAGVALSLLLGIVWWTWPRRERKDKGDTPEGKPESRH